MQKNGISIRKKPRLVMTARGKIGLGVLLLNIAAPLQGLEEIVLEEGFIDTKLRTIEVISLPLDRLKRTAPLASFDPKKCLTLVEIVDIAKGNLEKLVGVLTWIGDTWIKSDVSEQRRRFFEENPEICFDIGRTSWSLHQMVARPVRASFREGRSSPADTTLDGRFFYEVQFMGCEKKRKELIGPVSIFVFQDGTLLPVRTVKASDDEIRRTLHIRGEAEKEIK